MTALPRPGSEIFALLDKRSYAIWWDTTDIGLCVHPSSARDYFRKPPALWRALEAARGRHPCTPVGRLILSLPSGLGVEAGSRSMPEADVRRTAESVALQGWQLFCSAAAAGTCDRAADYEISISLHPGYCTALLYAKGNAQRLGAYRCDPQFRVAIDDW